MQRRNNCGWTIHNRDLAQALDQQAAVGARLDLEVRNGANEVGEAGVTEVASGKARHGLGPLTELGQGRIALFIALGEALLTIIPFTAGGVGLVEGGMAAMILLFNHGTANAGNMSAAAIVLDRTISLLSIWVIGFLLFMFAFGRQAARKKILTQTRS